MARKAAAQALGTVFNPKVVGIGYRVRFEYEKGSFFEVFLHKDSALEVRVTGKHVDQLATHHHSSNSTFLVPRRYNTVTEQYMELVK